LHTDRHLYARFQVISENTSSFINHLNTMHII
jgi:hypothetical protein